MSEFAAASSSFEASEASPPASASSPSQHSPNPSISSTSTNTSASATGHGHGHKKDRGGEGVNKGADRVKEETHDDDDDDGRTVLRVREILVDWTRLAREQQHRQHPQTGTDPSPLPDRTWSISRDAHRALARLQLLPSPFEHPAPAPAPPTPNSASTPTPASPDFSPYLSLRADIDPDLVTDWIRTKARLEYYPDENLLRLRMPTSIVHEQVTAGVTRILHTNFKNALDTLLDSLPEAHGRSYAAQLVTRMSANVPLASSASFSPDDQLAWAHRTNPSMVIETEYGNPLPDDKPFQYINGTSARVRTVLVIHIQFTPLEHRIKAEPEEQRELALSLYRVMPDGLDDSGQPMTDTFQEWNKTPVPRDDTSPPILTLPLACLHEDLDEDTTISVRNQQLYEIVDAAFTAQRRRDLKLEDTPPKAQHKGGKRKKGSEDDGDGDENSGAGPSKRRSKRVSNAATIPARLEERIVRRTRSVSRRRAEEAAGQAKRAS